MSIVYNEDLNYNSILFYDGTGGGYLRTTIRRRTVGAGAVSADSADIGNPEKIGAVPARSQKSSIGSITREGSL